MPARFFAAALLAAPLIVPIPALAADPTAVVEDVSEGAGGLTVFDFLEPGQNIELGPEATLVVGYLTSCVREFITGGHVTIGQTESLVSGGELVREVVECRGGEALLSQSQAAASGVVVLRGEEGNDAMPFKLYSLHPAFVFEKPTQYVMITRLDRPQATIKLAVVGSNLDTSKIGFALSAGGTYRTEARGLSRQFKVVRHARPGGALVSRLVRF